MSLVEYEPALVEEAVLHALREDISERAFRRERDQVYEVRDAEAREAAFRRLHAAWFEKLALGRPIAQAIDEQPIIAAATHGCRVASARLRQEEGAELFVRPAGEGPGERDRRWVVIRLRPEALGSGDHLLRFLRHELFHIADMLDPRFGYVPHLPPSPAGPANERLLRDRYRVLWDATIDGRMVRLGWAPATVRAERLREFARTFPRLGACTEGAFARFFDGPSATHADLAAFAAHPGGPLVTTAEGPQPGERCPLCRFPTYDFEPDPAGLPEEVLSWIRGDSPGWDPVQGLCRQCAELYRARPESLSAAGRGRTP